MLIFLRFICFDILETGLYVPVTKLKLALNPLRVVIDAAAAAELRDVRVTCKLPDAPLINVGGLLSAQ